MLESTKATRKAASSTTKLDDRVKTTAGGKSAKEANHHQQLPYKQRHNIGRRMAAERIASYNEGELAEWYPGGRWLAGNAEFVGLKALQETSEDTDVESQASGESKRKKNYSSLSRGGKAPSGNKAKKSSNEEESMGNANASKKSSTLKGKLLTTPDVNRQVRQKTSTGKVMPKVISEPKGSLSSEATGQKISESKEPVIPELVGKRQTKTLRFDKTPSQDQSPTKSTAKKVVSKSSDKAVTRGVVYDSEPEAPRGKRMARLNAEAIMSLMCERDEPVASSRRHPTYSGPMSFESDSEDNSSMSTDFSDYDDDSDRAFKRQVTANKILHDRREVAAKAPIVGSPDGQSASKAGSTRSKVPAKAATSNKKILGKELEKNFPKDDSKFSKRDILKGDTELLTHASSPPPKRMASLNAQAILAASKEDKIKKPRLSSDVLNLATQKTEEKSPVSGRNVATSDTGKTVEHRTSGGNNSSTFSPSDRNVHVAVTERQSIDILQKKAGCVASAVVASVCVSGSRPDIILTSSSLPFKASSGSCVSGAGACPPVNQSSMTKADRGGQSSKSQSRNSQSRNRTFTDRSMSGSQHLSDWQRHSIDGHSNSSGVSGGGFCQPVLAAAQSQAIGFPVATRLTATVAPSPARFNVPVIVPQPSVAGYLAAAARPPHHAYYPYAAGQNVFAYPIAGYPSTAHSYGSSTVASWSGLQDISQFSYQPGLAASICQTGAGRGGGVLQQQHQLPLHSHQQAAHFFRPCFEPVTQPQQYQNIQPAQSSLALYPTRLGVVASSDIVLPSRHISNTAGSKCYDLQPFSGISSGSALPVQPSTVPPTQFANASASSPSVKTKRSSASGLVQNSLSPASVATPQSQRDSTSVQSQREAVSCSGSDSSSPLVKSYYVLGNDRRSGTVVTESTLVTASNLLQPFGIYAGCVSTPFNVTGLSPGQTSQAMHLGCFQPAGPLLPMPAFWDLQGFGQVPHLTSAIKQPCVEMAMVEKVPTMSVARTSHSESRGDSCTQTVGTSGTTSKGSGKKSRTKFVAELNNGGAGKVYTPKKMETAVVTAIQMSGGNHYSGDQEHELDLSQKKAICTPKSSAGSEILPTATGHKVESGLQTSLDKSICDAQNNDGKTPGVVSSEIDNLEKFVSGMVVDKSKSGAVAQSLIDDKQVQSNPVKKPPKRKLDLSSDGSPHSKTDKYRSPSAKKAKTSSSSGNGEAISSKDSQMGRECLEQNIITSCVTVPRESDTAVSEDKGVVSSSSSVPSHLGTEIIHSSVVGVNDSIPSSNEHCSAQTGNEVHSGTTQTSPDACESDLDALSDLVSAHANSSSKSPTSVVADSETITLPVHEVTDTAKGNTNSPVKNSPAASSAKSSSALESGRKRRRELLTALARDKKYAATGESSIEEKVPKQRNPDDSMRKPNRKETGQWEWHGSGEMKLVHSKQADMPAVMRMCYSAVRHADGDVIFVRDCVLVKSGMRKKDIPYVAKIDKFWEDQDTGEMFMSILWYYRLEHTGADPLPQYIDCEVFASRHRDVIPVACIEDRCYVLTLAEFSRYKAELSRQQSDCPPRVGVVPPLASLASDIVVGTKDQPIARPHQSGTRLPDYSVDQGTVFLCRQVYDVKLRRILKNPPIHSN